MTDWVLSVDFGTSNTAAAAGPVGQPDRARVVKLSSASTEMPSGVLAHRDGRLLAGEVARNSAGANPPDAYERTPKRRLGEGALFLGGRTVTDVEMVAAVLKAVVGRAARQFDGQPPVELRLTHPVMWAEPRLEVLREAGRRAALPEPLLVPEPVAAATWYGVTHSGRRPGGPVAVFDIGGGTVDVAVLQPAQDGGFEILACGGDASLGGEAFDEELLTLVRAAVTARGEGDLWDRVMTTDGTRGRRTLLDEVRRAKHTLSDEPIGEVALVSGDEGAVVAVTRAELEYCLRPSLRAAVQVTRRALAEADVGPGDLAALYLVGGSSYVPLVAAMLTGELGITPATFDDPKTVTALGALYADAAGLDPVDPPLPSRPPAPVPPESPEKHGSEPPGSVDQLGRTTVAELKKALPSLAPEERVALLAHERAGRQRKTAIAAIEASLAETEPDDRSRTDRRWEATTRRAPRSASPREIAGFLLKSAAVLCLVGLLVMSFAGVEDSGGSPWTSPYALGFVLAAVLGLVGFLLDE